MNTNPFALRPDRRRRRSRTGGTRRATNWYSFFGAGALIAVGYMDPGNWATALAAGAGFGYRLLDVVLVSSLIGMLLQWTSSRQPCFTRAAIATPPISPTPTA